MNRQTLIPWILVALLVGIAIQLAAQRGQLEISLIITLVALGLYLLVEHQKRPRIRIEVEPTPSDGFRPAIKKNARFLHVLVTNEGLGLPWSIFLRRDISWLTIARLEFSHTGTTAPLFSFDGRWSDSPEPFVQAVAQERQVGLRDRNLILRGRRSDIPAGQSSPLAVALKVDDDSDAYGFTNESYWAVDPLWRRDEWALENGTYDVAVTIRIGDIEHREVFQFRNEGRRATGLNWLTGVEAPESMA